MASTQSFNNEMEEIHGLVTVIELSNQQLQKRLSKLTISASYSENTFANVNQAFDFLLIGQKLNDINLSNYCAEWILKQRTTNSVVQIQDTYADYQIARRKLDIDVSKIDITSIRDRSKSELTTTYVKNLLLLKEPTIIDLLNNLDSINKMDIPTEAYLKLVDDPNLVVDSENSVFQFIWSFWQHIRTSQEISTLSKIKFDHLTENFVMAMIRYFADIGKCQLTQSMVKHMFMLKKNGTIPRIMMNNPIYKKELKINMMRQDLQYGQMSGQGYLFSFRWNNPNIKVYCTAGGAGWTHTCVTDEYFNLTIVLTLKFDRYGKPEEIIEQKLTFDKNHQNHEVKLFDMQPDMIPMENGLIIVRHFIIFPQEQ